MKNMNHSRNQVNNEVVVEKVAKNAQPKAKAVQRTEVSTHKTDKVHSTVFLRYSFDGMNGGYQGL